MADVGTDVFRHKGAAIIWRTLTRIAHREEYREFSLCALIRPVATLVAFGPK